MDKKLKILFLEDRSEDVSLLKFELKKADLKFVSQVAANREEFLTKLDEFQPDFILSDYSLPQFTGLDAIRIVQQKTPETPIIIVTGSINEETAVQCMREGAWDYVLKGRLVQIRQAIKNALKLKKEKARIDKARKELAASQQHLNNLISNLPGIVYRCMNDNNWTMKFISEGFESMTGYKVEDVIDNKKISYADIIHPSDRQKVWQTIQNAIAKKEHFRLEYRIVTADKKIRWFWEQGMAVSDQKEDRIILDGFISDISQLKENQDALEKSRLLFKEQSELLNGVFNSIPDMMGIQDNDRRIIRYNQAGYDFLNMEYDDVVGKKCYELIGQQDPCEECATEITYKTKKAAQIEKYMPEIGIWLDVRAYPLLDDKGEIVKVIEHIRDITARKSAERELILSEERMKAIFRNAYDVIVIVDFISGKILDVNLAVKRLLKYDPQKLIGRKFAVLFPEETSIDRMDLIKDIKVHGPVFESQQFKRADGSICPMDLTANEIPWNGKDVAMVTLRDITERNKAEEFLRESEERFRTFAENVPGVVSIYTRHPDGRLEFHYQGPGLEEIIGQELFAKTEKDPRAFFDLIPKEDLEKLEADAVRAVQTNEVLDSEYRLEIKPGEYVWVRSRFSVAKMADGSYFWQGIINEITEQKLIEQELIESEQLSMAVIEDSPIGISVRDKNGTLILHNEAWQRIWGLTNNDIERYKKKKTSLKMDDKDSYLKEHQKAIKEIYKTGGSYFVPEIKLNPDKRGKAEWITQRFYAIMSDIEEVERVVILTEDISERKKAEVLKNVLHNIATQVNLSSDLVELLDVIRMELSRIIDTTNFFVALKDEATGQLIFPYTRDEKDGDDFEISEGKTLSAYVMKIGKPLLATEEIMQDLENKGLIEPVGSDCKIWLGAPLISQDKTIGIVAMQSYKSGDLYTEKDMEILSFVSHEIALAIDKKRAEDEIIVQKSYFENLFQVSPDALVIVNNQDKIIQINEEFTNLFGFTQEEVFGKRINDLIVPEDMKEEARQKTQEVASGKKIFFESIRQNKNGDRLYVEAIGKPIFMGENQLAVQAIYRDVSVRKKHEQQIMKDLEEKEVLLKEVHHRVKNNMQVISSMLKLQSRYIEDPKALELFTNSQNRVKSMSLIHERIYKSKDLASVNFEDYVQNLTRSLFTSSSVSSNNIKLELDMKDLTVNMNKAVPLGLIINELISNALKHAFPNHRKGILKISFSKQADGFKLVVADDGVGFEKELDTKNPDSLGLQLINALTAQLHGDFSMVSDNGTKCILRF